MFDKIMWFFLLFQIAMVFEEKKYHEQASSELVELCHPLVKSVKRNVGLDYVLYPCSYVDLYCKDDYEKIIVSATYKKLYRAYKVAHINLSGRPNNESVVLVHLLNKELNLLMHSVYDVALYQKKHSLQVTEPNNKELRKYYEQQCKNHKMDNRKSQQRRYSKHGVQY